MKVIGHQTIADHAHLASRVGTLGQFSECQVVTVIVKNTRATISAIYDVVTDTAHGCTSCSSHAQILESKRFQVSRYKWGHSGFSAKPECPH
jgi:hypothetical protein